MKSMRRRKSYLMRYVLKRHLLAAWEDRLWDRMPAVGREFGSPDFDRLMGEDYCDGVVVFDRALIPTRDRR